MKYFNLLNLDNRVFATVAHNEKFSENLAVAVAEEYALSEVYNVKYCASTLDCLGAGETMDAEFFSEEMDGGIYLSPAYLYV